uniref:Uncharacterized protein n=1 Tax=Anguilla anguilla TaxID=7936 RepID=A0A0E9TZ65_ANGAN
MHRRGGRKAGAWGVRRFLFLPPIGSGPYHLPLEFWKVPQG